MGRFRWKLGRSKNGDHTRLRGYGLSPSVFLLHSITRNHPSATITRKNTLKDFVVRQRHKTGPTSIWRRTGKGSFDQTPSGLRKQMSTDHCKRSETKVFLVKVRE